MRHLHLFKTNNWFVQIMRNIWIRRVICWRSDLNKLDSVKRFFDFKILNWYHFPWIHKFQIDISLQFPFCQSFSQLSPVNGVIFHVFRKQHFEMKCFGSNFLLFIINFKFKFGLYFCRCWFGIWGNFAASRVCSVRGRKFTCVFQCQTSTSSSSIFLLLIFQTSSISQPFSWQRIALWLWLMIW